MTSDKHLILLRNAGKRIRIAGFAVVGSILALCGAAVTYGQPASVSFRVVPGTPGRVVIEGSGAPRTAWSFRDSYAGVLGLGGRIENLELRDAGGSQIAIRRIAPGQYDSASAATQFRYEVNLGAPARSANAALVSWLNAERGLLMIGDLLPVNETSDWPAAGFRLRVAAPGNWRVHSTEPEAGQGEFLVRDADRAVIMVGQGLRASSQNIAGSRLTLVTDGQWAFRDGEAMDVTEKIAKAHREVAGVLPCKDTAVFLMPFPESVAADKWSAQTRGCTVSLLMGKQPSRVGALAHLGNALTHEMFHLWIPNALALSGEYDWFFEGFTIYQAARTAVRLDLLTFPEFLNALSRAYDGSAAADRDRLSLIDASKRRWTVGESAVYSKAMVVAFLCDLNLRHQSKGKRSLDDVYRRLFREHLPPAHREGSAKVSDGNMVVTRALSEELSGPAFVQRFINEPFTVELQKELAQFGLRVEKIGSRTRIFVGDSLGKQQRDLLRQLGYNDRVR